MCVTDGVISPFYTTPLFKYAIVGFTGVLINMGLLYVLTDIVGIYYLVSSILAIELSIINNFIWNDRWTFSGEQHSKSTLSRIVAYHIISILGALLNVLILYTLTTWMGFYYLLSNMVAIVGVFVINFILNQRITWKKRVM